MRECSYPLEHFLIMSSPLGSFFKTCNEKQVYFTKGEISEMKRQLYQNINLLTEEEARELERYHHLNISNICKSFHLPFTSQLIAHYLLNRYCLSHTVLTYDLKHAMLTACYLAAKLENHRILLNELCAKIKNVSRQIIEELEFVYLEMLEYEIWIFAPYIPTLAFLMEMNIPLDEEINLKINEQLELIYRTEIPLIHRPIQIAQFVLNKLFPDVFYFENARIVIEPEERSLNKELLKDIDKRIMEFRKQNQS